MGEGDWGLGSYLSRLLTWGETIVVCMCVSPVCIYILYICFFVLSHVVFMVSHSHPARVLGVTGLQIN